MPRIENPQGGPENQFRPDAVNKVRTVVIETGAQVLWQNPRIGALHGTSRISLEAMLTTGKLPGNRAPGTGDYLQGDVSIFPTDNLRIPSDLETRDVVASRDGPDDVFNNIKHYASAISQRHTFLTRLGLPLTDIDDLIHVWPIMNPEGTVPGEEEESFQHFRSRGLTDQQIHKAASEAQIEKGFLLGFSTEIAKSTELTLMRGDLGDSDLRIRSADREGLPIKYLTAIEPLGDREAEWLGAVVSRDITWADPDRFSEAASADEDFRYDSSEEDITESEPILPEPPRNQEQDLEEL